MNRKKAGIVIAVFLVLGALALMLLPVMIESAGKANTNYSAQYDEEGFEQIEVGMSAELVVELLGEPLSRESRNDYPVWALREESVRERLGKDSKIEFVVWFYARPKNPRKDFELVQVCFGPGRQMIDKERFVTD